MARTASSRTRD